MKQFTRFVHLYLETLEDRALPGNLLSAFLASEYFGTTAQRQLVKPQEDLVATLSESGSELDKSLQWMETTELPEQQAPRFYSGKTSTDELARELTDSRSDLLDDSLFTSLFTNDSGSFVAPVSKMNEQPDDLAILSTAISNAIDDKSPVTPATPLTPVLETANQATSDELLQYVSQKQEAVEDNPPMVARSEGAVIHQDVPINANDDNGSAITEYIPAKYDYQAVKSDYPANTADPELIEMPMIDDTPPNPHHLTTRGIYNYTLTVSPLPGNHYKLWDTPYKDHQYSEFDTPSIQNLTENENATGFYSWPTIYIEGTDPSLTDDDITITLTVNADVNGSVWISHYRTVQATVTPRVDYLKIDNVRTLFGIVQNPNYNPNTPPPNPIPAFIDGPNSQTGVFDYAEFRAKTIGDRGQGIPAFVQNAMPDTKDLLTAGQATAYAISRTDGKIARRVLTPANENFPFVDSNPTVNPYYPLYKFFTRWSPELNGPVPTKNGPDPADKRIYYIESNDATGFKDGSGNIWNALKAVNKFKLWLIIAYPAKNNQTVWYGLANIKWTANLEATNYQPNQGLTTIGGSVVPDPTAEISTSLPDRKTGPLAAEAFPLGPYQ